MIFRKRKSKPEPVDQVNVAPPPPLPTFGEMYVHGLAVDLTLTIETYRRNHPLLTPQMADKALELAHLQVAHGHVKFDNFWQLYSDLHARMKLP